MLYLDASALVKLIRHEPETGDLVNEVRTDPAAVSSALSRTEVVRAVRRARGDADRAEAVIAGVALVPIDDAILQEAAVLRPTTLRTLDAIHLATAISLGGDLDRVIAYDVRLIEAAVGVGLTVMSPGARMS